MGHRHAQAWTEERQLKVDATEEGLADFCLGAPPSMTPPVRTVVLPPS